jgi:hypothetical protein
MYTLKDRTILRAGKTIVSHATLFDLFVSTSISPIHRTYKHAFANPNWSVSMRSEYNVLLQHDSWQLAPKPTGANVVSGKWVFRHKYNPDGSLSRYKARWESGGFLKNTGSTIHIVLSRAVSFYWHIHQLDVKNAFLHGNHSMNAAAFDAYGIRLSETLHYDIQLHTQY